MDTGTVAVAAAATAQPDTKAIVHDFVYDHVMYHMAEADTYNLPFVHVKLLDIFRYDHVMVVFTCIVLILIFGLLYKPRPGAPHGWTNLFEIFAQFIRNQIAVAFLGENDGTRLAPVFCSFFFFILLANLMGLVPLFSTITGNINVTGALALITMGFMVIGSVRRIGWLGFFRTFVPPGVPVALACFIAPLEFISMLTKVVALMIRLFANMLAGHIIIYSLIGLMAMFGLWAAPVVLIVLFVYLFELFIAFFQAYIFTLLSAIYMGQLYHPEH